MTCLCHGRPRIIGHSGHSVSGRISTCLRCWGGKVHLWRGQYAKRIHDVMMYGRFFGEFWGIFALALTNLEWPDFSHGYSNQPQWYLSSPFTIGPSREEWSHGKNEQKRGHFHKEATLHLRSLRLWCLNPSFGWLNSYFDRFFIQRVCLYANI